MMIKNQCSSAALGLLISAATAAPSTPRLTGARRDRGGRSGLAELTAGGKVLDLGCGAGALVEKLQEAGFDAWGCDGEFGSGTEYRCETERLRRIGICPYRLPFSDRMFDAVITISVLEHVSNKDEMFREIYRVLKHGGTMIHIFPSKWYLPAEPHIFVPFANWVWPWVPRWWLALWAIVGVRNSFESGMSWHEVVDTNLAYCRAGLDYWPFSKLTRCVRSIFGQCTYADRYHLGQKAGIVARTSRALPFAHFDGTAYRPTHFTGGLLCGINQFSRCMVRVVIQR
jgi:SAM-dependent methyltransferase